MDKRDSEKMIRLAREGKIISKIWEDDFPNYDYWDVYLEVYGAGERSSVGVKRMITSRLNDLLLLPRNQQQQLIDEIKDLVSHLYDRYKEGQKKLDKIRAIIEK